MDIIGRAVGAENPVRVTPAQIAEIQAALRPQGGVIETIAGFVGSMVGSSLSPEMWVAVGLVVWQSRSFLRFLGAAALGAFVVVGLRFAVIERFALSDAVVSIAAVFVWSGLGALIRAAVSKRKGLSPAPARGEL